MHCCTYFVAMRSRTAEKLSQEIPREKLFPVRRQNLGKDAHCRPGKGKITREGEGKGLVRIVPRARGRGGMVLHSPCWPNVAKWHVPEGAKAATDVRAAMGVRKSNKWCAAPRAIRPCDVQEVLQTRSRGLIASEPWRAGHDALHTQSRDSPRRCLDLLCRFVARSHLADTLPRLMGVSSAFDPPDSRCHGRLSVSCVD